MNFMEIALNRQSCRSYEENKAVEKEKLDAVLEAGRLAPSACNGQPYHFTVVTGEKAKEAAEKEAERRRIQKLNLARMKPVQASWQWDGEDAPTGMPPTCTVPKAEMERLVRELGLEEGHAVYLKCNGKKILVTGENAGSRVELNAAAAQVIQQKPKKGQKYLLSGELGYSYEFKKVSAK